MTAFHRILFVALCAASMASPMNAQWTLTSDDTMQSASVFSFTGSGTTIIAGSFGYGVMRSADNGATWTAVNNGLPTITYAPGLKKTDVYGIAASGPNIFASTYGNGVYRSTDNGAHWAAVNVGLTDSVSTLAFSGSNLVAGTQRGVYLSTNNGTNWAAVNSGIPAFTHVWCLGVSGTTILAGTQNGAIYRSTNNGASWTASATNIPGSTSIRAFTVSGSRIFAATYYNGIYLSTDNGATWTAVNNGLPTGSWGYSLCASGTTIFAGIYVSEYRNEIYMSPDNGANWHSVSNGLPTHKQFYSLAVSGTTLFTGASQGVYARPLAEMLSAPAAPALASPSDGAKGNPAGQRLTWSPVEGASSYQVIVTTGVKTSVVTVFEKSGIDTTSYVVYGLAGGTTYGWRVTASNYFGTSIFSTQRSFTTGPLALPDIVTLVSPANDASVGADSVRFVWRSATPYAASYELTLTGDAPVVYTVADTFVTLRVPVAKSQKLYTWNVRAKNLTGFGSVGEPWSLTRLTTDVSRAAAIPSGFAISNYPNPFNPSTTFTFDLPSRSFVTLTIFDALGRSVSSVVSEELPAGSYTLPWSGAGLSSGMYFYRLHAGQYSATRSLLLLR